MIVGAAVVEIRVHESRSLKAKRGVVRSISGRLRNRFNVSVAEVGGQGTWQRAVLGLSMTGSEEVPLRRALEKAVAFVSETHLAEVIASDIEMIRLPLSESSASSDAAATMGSSGEYEMDEIDDLPWSRDPSVDDGTEE
jgi:hypothetical protein